jgi:hypothetical protein
MFDIRAQIFNLRSAKKGLNAAKVPGERSGGDLGAFY